MHGVLGSVDCTVASAKRATNIGRGRATVSEEVWLFEEKTRRVLQAAAVEAYGRPVVYVQRGPVMSRANISDVAEFVTIAEHLERMGWIAEADADYGIFVLTPEGIDEAQN
jgi:hypothetical protein